MWRNDLEEDGMRDDVIGDQGLKLRRDFVIWYSCGVSYLS